MSSMNSMGLGIGNGVKTVVTEVLRVHVWSMNSMGLGIVIEFIKCSIFVVCVNLRHNSTCYDD